jgi:hypothetical protein
VTLIGKTVLDGDIGERVTAIQPVASEKTIGDVGGNMLIEKKPERGQLFLAFLIVNSDAWGNMRFRPAPRRSMGRRIPPGTAPSKTGQ